MAETIKNTPTSEIAERLMVARRELQSNLPWDDVKEVVIYIIENHPEILMVFNNKLPSLLMEMGKQLPANISSGEFAGIVNPLLIEVRAALRRN